MRLTRLVILGGFLIAAPLKAQDASPDDPGRATELRRLIEERFTARVQEELGLSEQQSAKLREVVWQYFAKRRAMEAEERRLRQALAAELRPGVAANKDNVARLTDQLLDVKLRYVQSYKDELRDQSSFLDPVQRAQYIILRERLLDRIKEAQDARGADSGAAPTRRRRLLRP
jgi:septum formation topological specificity factor MinE